MTSKDTGTMTSPPSPSHSIPPLFFFPYPSFHFTIFFLFLSHFFEDFLPLSIVTPALPPFQTRRGERTPPRDGDHHDENVSLESITYPRDERVSLLLLFLLSLSLDRRRRRANRKTNGLFFFFPRPSLSRARTLSLSPSPSLFPLTRSESKRHIPSKNQKTGGKTSRRRGRQRRR